MKRTVFMLTLAMMLLLSAAASGQMNQPSGGASAGGTTTATPGGAPTPITPSTPDSMNLQIPSDISVSQETPSAQERTQTLISTNQEAAYAYAPSSEGPGGITGTGAMGGAGSMGTAGAMGSTGPATSTRATYSTGPTATSASQTYSMVITPQGSYAPNSLYISYAPRTVASCNLYANLPLWMKTTTQGHIWFYEWYPSGMLDTNYAGYVYYPGWYKRWFFADTPGWHIMQYYCNGWSNYAYIYVYGPSGYWVNPYPEYDSTPYPYPYWDSEITYTYPPTGHTYYSYSSSVNYGDE